jgi:hypothetical protein
MDKDKAIVLVDDGGNRDYFIMERSEISKLVNSDIDMDVEWDVVEASVTKTADELLAEYGEPTDGNGFTWCGGCGESYQVKDGEVYCPCGDGD